MTSKQETLNANAQRDALGRSEKKAARAQPENFKDADTAEKIVEIGPDVQHAPIEGIDPPQTQRKAPASSSVAGEEDPGAALDDAGTRDAMRGEARRASKRRG